MIDGRDVVADVDRCVLPPDSILCLMFLVEIAEMGMGDSSTTSTGKEVDACPCFDAKLGAKVPGYFLCFWRDAKPFGYGGLFHGMELVEHYSHCNPFF